MRSQHQNGGRWIRRDRRLAIYLRDNFRCLVCFADLRNKPGELTLDHVVTRSRGGHHEKNLYTCCRSCNSRRQDKPLAVFVRQRIAELHPNPFPWCTDTTEEVAAGRVSLIRSQRRRKLTKYRKQARLLLTGDLAVVEAIERRSHEA